MEKGKEIRMILLGRTVTENGLLRAARQGEVPQTVGAANGWLTIFFAGITSAKAEVTVPGSLIPLDTMATVLTQLGSPVYLEDHPDALAALSRASMQEEVLYTTEFNKRTITVTVFAGRGLASGLVLSNALRAFQRRLPDGSEFRRLEREKRSKNKKAGKMEKTAKKKEADRDTRSKYHGKFESRK